MKNEKGFFMKMFAHEQKDVNKEDLLHIVNKMREDLDLAYRNFETVTDDALVDSYIYEVQSIQKKYEYYLKEAKKMNLISNIN